MYLAALDSLIEVLTQTPVRDTANNPIIMAPVPSRSHLSVPPSTASLAEFVAYAVNDANDRAAWNLLHPFDKILNHRPTDTTAIKNNVMLALGSSIYASYSILAQRYRQTDHANRTWTDLHQDSELIITNNNTGTSRDFGLCQRDHHTRDWRPTTHRQDQPPSDSRASRTLYAAYHDEPSSTMILHGKRTLDHPQHPPNEVRAATPTSGTPSPATKNAYPCSNCGADHRSVDCDNPKCLQLAKPTTSASTSATLNALDSDRTTQPAAVNTLHQPHLFLSRSVEDMHKPSPYDSGYDSTFSRASGPRYPPHHHTETRTLTTRRTDISVTNV